MSKAILAKRKAEAEQRQRDEDAASRAYFAKIPDNRQTPQNSRSGSAWGGRFEFGKGKGQGCIE